MRAFLATNVMGSFAFDSQGNLLEKRLFPKQPEEIAERLQATELIPEEQDILKSLIKKGMKEVITDKKASFKGISLVFEEENLGKRTLQEEFRGLAISLKWVTSQAELNELLSKVNVLKTKTQLRTERRDKIVMHAVGMLSGMEKEANSLTERLREWYGLHFPELSREVQSNEKYASLIAKHGTRSEVKGYQSLAAESAGMDFSPQDIREVQRVARSLVDMHVEKATLEQYLQDLCKEVIPNTAAVAGEILGAKLIAAAGGLEKLSRLPSSTVQILGAEKALFRHLKNKESKAPKYGLLFAHALVQNAAPEQKGKAARLIAAKISLAAKTDFFSKENKGDELVKELEEKVNQL